MGWVSQNKNITETKDHLQTESIEVNTGNAVFDQLAPWQCGVAFAYDLYV